ncbi:ankyrin-3 [Biomphalaria glabrata]|uniref:Ankyrin homolog n=1 Tax=Biomphalaria glabrata TaxID=6526 RepID=A0A9W2ZTC0_BIOGL|nr:ankyrin homolog [Biomphalaria glabrata]XP_055878201.1 ankyrin homolog [Biomphalaria glabrata]KAI8741536.1 ankyrin-3-like [Biomphalaria glabrata]
MEFSQLQEIFHEIQTFMSQVMQIRTEPTETLQALGLLEHNYEALKNMLMISDYKKELERAELNDLTNLTSDLDKLEVNFDVTYLMICAMFGYEEKGKELLLRGASVNQQNRQGLTALMFASMFQFDEFVRMLLENGADVNLKDNRQMDALMWAVLQGHDDITQILLDHGADVLSKTPSRLDALHISVEKGFTSIVEMLLERNVCVSSKSLDGWTPLMRSARLQDSKIAKLLLQRNLNVNETTFQGITALHISVMYQNLKCIRRLLKRGANINCKDIMGLTPLMYAAGFDNVQVICTLFENGATKSINDVNNTNQSALFRAVIGNVENIVHLLISAGATTNIFDINDFSPIIYASYNQRTSIVEQLLKHKDSAWHKSNEFETCLRLAVSKNDVGTTKCLLNVQNVEQILSDRKKLNTTILSVAVMNGNKDMAKLLLGAGADVNAVNGLLQSVLFTSITQKDVDMATLLVQKYGADVNLKDFRGDTPLILAASSNNKPMVDLLLS